MKLEDIIKLETTELEILRKTITDVIKVRRGETVALMKATLTEGMKVTVNHKKVAGLVGTITKVNRKKAKVNFGIGDFTVPLNMIEIWKVQH
mgnify:FL=1|tara:strand:- start:1124 stop:1399 length:276 start_codon:yes stop_codon:yes gene_type:complete